MANTPEISIIIPVYNGRDTIDSCVNSILQATKNINSEIILVDSGNDNSGKTISEKYDVTLITSQTQLSVGAARNLGSKKAIGEIIAFVDQDCLVPTDWAIRIINQLKNDNLDGIGGSVAPDSWTNISGLTLYFLEFLYHLPSNHPTKINYKFLLGCNSAYKRQLTNQVKFPEITITEDVLFSENIKQKGFVTAYDPSLTVTHKNKTGWENVLNYLCSIGEAAARYRKKYRSLLMDLIDKLPLSILLSPVIVIILVGKQVLITKKAQFILAYILILPACFLGSFFWAIGFYREITDKS